jgi:hypothetical protein
MEIQRGHLVAGTNVEVEFEDACGGSPMVPLSDPRPPKGSRQAILLSL